MSGVQLLSVSAVRNCTGYMYPYRIIRSFWIWKILVRYFKSKFVFKNNLENQSITQLFTHVTKIYLVLAVAAPGVTGGTFLPRNQKKFQKAGTSFHNSQYTFKIFQIFSNFSLFFQKISLKISKNFKFFLKFFKFSLNFENSSKVFKFFSRHVYRLC